MLPAPHEHTHTHTHTYACVHTGNALEAGGGFTPGPGSYMLNKVLHASTLPALSPSLPLLPTPLVHFILLSVCRCICVYVRVCVCACLRVCVRVRVCIALFLHVHIFPIFRTLRLSKASQELLFRTLQNALHMYHQIFLCVYTLICTTAGVSCRYTYRPLSVIPLIDEMYV
jgi:hypothetical protein